MNLESRRVGDALCVVVQERRIDAAIAVQFRDAVHELSAEAPSRIVLDMTSVEFIDSSGLGAIVGAMKLLAPDRRLELAGLSGAAEKVFTLTRMDTVFRIHPDPAAALGAAADAR